MRSLRPQSGFHRMSTRCSRRVRFKLSRAAPPVIGGSVRFSADSAAGSSPDRETGGRVGRSTARLPQSLPIPSSHFQPVPHIPGSCATLLGWGTTARPHAIPWGGTRVPAWHGPASAASFSALGSSDQSLVTPGWVSRAARRRRRNHRRHRRAARGPRTGSERRGRHSGDRVGRRRGGRRR